MPENYSLKQIVQLFIEKSKEAKRELGQFNILIIGKAGVGKSTLINNVFKFDKEEEKAMTGAGFPVTNNIKQYTIEGCPLTIYDTPGIELDVRISNEIKTNVTNLITDKRSRDIKEHIHIIWYCVNETSCRFEESENRWIQDLISKDEVPVIIVLTQTNDPKISKMLPFLQGLNLPVNAIIPIMAQDQLITTTLSIPAYGLENLVEETAKLIPVQAERAFIHQQVASINLQAIQADKYLIAYVMGGAIIGATEAVLVNIGALLGLQVTMLAQISVIFAIDFDEKFLSILITSIAGSKGTEEIGKIFIQELLKLMGVSAITAPITATITATMTLSLGRAYIEGIKWYRLALAKEENITPEQLATMREQLVTKVKEIYKKLVRISKDNN